MKSGLKLADKAVLLGAFLVSAVHGVRADDFPASQAPTYARDVAPVLLKNCAECHRPGESAPMSLLSYEETRPWVKAIRKAVVSREMPPWDADPSVGTFKNDISLTSEEIETIERWAAAGAPFGEEADLPEVPQFTSGWKLGEPDYVIELDEVSIPADGPNLFPNIESVIRLPEDRWIRAAEVRPGNPDVLHHLVAFVVNNPMGSTGLGQSLTGWAVGMPPVQYSEGMGRKVGRYTKLMVNMHYYPNGMATTDRTKIGLYFGAGELKKEVGSSFAGNITLRIPPHAAEHQETGEYFFRQDSYLSTLTPHMHLRGKTIKYTAVFPDGSERMLLNVPKYDFNWQWRYILDEPLLMPKGSVLKVAAVYDNSTANPHNPDPDAWVTFGEETGDEMLVGAFEYYPVEGVSPERISLDQRVDELLARVDSPDAYRVKLDLGIMQVPTILILGRGAPSGEWIVSLGEQAIPIPLQSVAWEGNRFSSSMSLFGGGAVLVRGVMGEDGTVQGDFDDSALQSAGGPTSMFDLKGFEGHRAARPAV